MITADEVGVRLEADVETYIRDIARADQEFTARMQNMSKWAVTAGNAVTVPLNHASKAYSDVGATIQSTTIPAMERYNTLASSTAMQTGNMVAQFNDVGVSLLSGQSSWIVAIQQGTQLNQVFADLRSNGTGLGGALTGAFTSFLNPLNFATIAIIGLGGEALKYFMDVISQGGEANLTLEQQAQIIQQVADRWGEAVPALKAYAEEVQRLKDQADDKKAFEIFSEDQFKVVNAELDTANNAFVELIRNLQSIPGNAGAVQELETTFEALRKKISENKDASAEVTQVISLLSSVIDTEGVSSVDRFTTAFAAFSKMVLNASDAVATLRSQISKTSVQDLAAAATFRDTDGTVRPVSQFQPFGNAPTPDRRPSDLSQYPDGGFKKPRQHRERKEQLNEYEQFTRKTREQTEALQAEYDAQEMLNPLIKDYGQAQNTAKLYQEGLNAAKRAGIELGPKERENLYSLAEGLAIVRAEQKKLQEEQRETLRSIEEWNNLAKSTVGGFINDLIKGKSAAEAFQGALGKIADQLIKIGLSNIFDSNKGGLLSGLFGSLFGLGGGGSDPWAGLRANGGPVSSGQAYIVGERRPEVFVPHVAGSIIPQVPNVSPSSGAMGGELAVRVYVDDDDKLRAMIDRQASSVAGNLVENSQAGEAARLPGNLRAIRERGMDR